LKPVSFPIVFVIYSTNKKGKGRKGIIYTEVV